MPRRAAARTAQGSDRPARPARLERPPENRSLVRGVEILRAFRPGAGLLGNGELAERTGLARATVSRLTQTLVGTGLLEHDAGRRAYRLAAPVLSLALAMRTSCSVLQAAEPLMRGVADKLKVNVGLAVADRDEMVYLESVRANRRASLRHIVAGQRIPMALTSLGRAHLAALPEARRKAQLARLKAAARPAGWRALEREIAQGVRQVHDSGWCAASWQPQVVALATPAVLHAGAIYVLNISVATPDAPADVARELAPPLLALGAGLREALARLAPGG